MVKTPRQIKAAQFRKTRKKWGQVKGIKPERDPEYRKWVATFPCVVCMVMFTPSAEAVRWQKDVRLPVSKLFEYRFQPWVNHASECAHVGLTGRGMRQKCSDAETLPMCVSHHREGSQALDKIGRIRFQEIFGFDLLAIAAELRRRYLMEAA